MAGGRPPLPVGTYGTIRTGRNRSGWWARARFRDLDGTTRLVERVGPTKGKAVERLREAMRDRDRDESGGDGTVSSNTRVSELAELWFAELRTRGASPGTLRLYRGRIDNQVVPKLGNLRGRELRTPAVDRCLNAVRDENGAAVARTTRTVLSGICGYAARKGALGNGTGNPVRDASTIRIKGRRQPVAFDVRQAMQLRALLTYDDLALRRDIPELVDAMLATGTRVGEALAIVEDAFDASARTVEVRGTVIRVTGEGLLIKPEPKTENGFRKLRLPMWAATTFERRFPATRPTDVRIFHGFDGEGRVIATVERHKLLFPSTRYKTKVALRDPSNVDSQLDAALAAAGYDGLTSHVFRKSVATIMDNAGLPARHASDQLGHSKVSMTSDNYFARKVASEEAASVLEAIDNFG
jgi:integrase